jgi:hypothetical protein
MDDLQPFALDERVQRVDVARLVRPGEQVPLVDRSELEAELARVGSHDVEGLGRERSECTKFAAGEPPAPVTRIRLI